MSAGKVLALFDVDGTLTKPRNVSARPRALDILKSRCPFPRSLSLRRCVTALRLGISVPQPDCLSLGQQEVTAEMKAFMAQLRGKVCLSCVCLCSLSLSL